MVTSVPTIPEVFAGADVFVTGGTGFMGKVLIEKLLRSCPKINKLFVLMRDKRGRGIEDRVKDFTDNTVFSVLRSEYPETLDKIVPIQGDSTKLRLGISDADFERLQNVQFIFNAAASVRFDDPLKDAILMNTRGTREVLEWAKTLKSLKAVVHISTTYCNPEVLHVEERIYPAKMCWRKAIQLAETLDRDTLSTFAKKLTNFAPNTYTYTKSLAEQICYDYRHELPLVVFRPSIVTNVESEPVPGWIDNFNGPTGLLLGCGTGLVRSGLINLEKHINCIPVDTSIKAILVAAWKRVTIDQPGDLPVYNSAAEPNKTVDYKTLLYNGRDIFECCPLSKVLWAPGGSATQCRFHFYLAFFFNQIIPAVLIDAIFRLTGRQPFIMKLQRKIFDSQVSLAYFMQNEWIFVAKKFRQLQEYLTEQDRKDFSIHYFPNGMMEYYRGCILGGRRYLMNDPDETIPAASVRYRWLIRIDNFIKVLLGIGLLYIIYKQYIVQYVAVQRMN